MLGLRLCSEFTANGASVAAIDLNGGNGTGAVEIGPDAFFALTYPTADVEKAFSMLSHVQEQQPIILMGCRGSGKSHLLATMYYAFAYPAQAETWAHMWGKRLDNEPLQQLRLQRGYLPIAEAMHKQAHPTVWDLLWSRHPQGRIFEKAFRRANAKIPTHTAIRTLLEAQPVALLLDEFQTWFDGLCNRPGFEQVRERTCAFMQILAEVACERPDLLRLVVSVRNNQTDAYRQLHQTDARLINFDSADSLLTRQRMVLHRLFENRQEIAPDLIRQRCTGYATVRSRLLATQEAPLPIERSLDEVVATWPFSPELFSLLDVLMRASNAAQGRRDVIRLLARLYRDCDPTCALLTPASFNLMLEGDHLQSLLHAFGDTDAVTRCRIARENLEAVVKAYSPAPHAAALLSALWVRSLAAERECGVTAAQLHLDLCGRAPIDDAAFTHALGLLREEAPHLHQTRGPQGLILRLHEEPSLRARIKMAARNNKLFQQQQECAFLRALTERTLQGRKGCTVQVLALPAEWQSEPWLFLTASEPLATLEGPLLLVLPEYPANLDATLGKWLKYRKLRHRNAVWFLLPRPDRTSIYRDPDLLYWARIACLTKESAAGSAEREIYDEFTGLLQEALSARFERLALLRHWSFREPERCRFRIEELHLRGAAIADAVQQWVIERLFAEQEQDFAAYLVLLAERQMEVGELMDDLRDPPPKPDALSFLYVGLAQVCQQLLRLAATGAIYLQIDGTWIGKRTAAEPDEESMQWLQASLPEAGRLPMKSRIGLPCHAHSTAADKPEPVELIDGPLYVTEPLNGLSILDQFERWGFRIDDQFSSLRLEFNAITFGEARMLLQRLRPYLALVVKATVTPEERTPR